MADENQVKRNFEHRAGNTVAFLSSLLFHIALLLALACWITAAGKPSRGLLLTADRGESTLTSLDLVQTFELEPQHNEPSAQQSSEASFSLDVDIESALDAPVIDTGGIVGELTSLSVGEVVENLNLQGRGRGASFFGAYAQGNRFVFVLDSSRSMNGDRWIYACNQLIDSLNGLTEDQEFFVICFDLQTSFLFNTTPDRFEYFRADDSVILRVRRWLRSRTLGSDTMPAEALQYALEFNPDAVFLLSDGELHDNSVMMLRILNGLASARRQIPVHTIHLFSAQGRSTLQQIARENSGTFTAVDGRR
jgi:hypothetical protein